MAAKPLAGSWRHPVAVQVSLVLVELLVLVVLVVLVVELLLVLELLVVLVELLVLVVLVVLEVLVELDVLLVELLVEVVDEDEVEDEVVVAAVLLVVELVDVLVVVVDTVVVVKQPGTGACWQPPAGSQVSVVQTFPSSQLTGLPTHRSAKQASAVVQALPSSHGAPSATTLW